MLNVDLLVAGKEANSLLPLVAPCFCIFKSFALLFGNRFPETNGQVIPGSEVAVNCDGEKDTVVRPT